MSELPPDDAELLERLVAGEDLSAEERARLDADPELAAHARELLGVIEYLDSSAHREQHAELVDAALTESATDGRDAQDRAADLVRRTLGTGWDTEAAVGPPSTADRMRRVGYIDVGQEREKIRPSRVLLGVVVGALAASLAFFLFIQTQRDAGDTDPKITDSPLLLSSSDGFEVERPTALVDGGVRIHWNYAHAPGGLYVAHLWAAGSGQRGTPLLSSGELIESTWTLNANDLEGLPRELELEIAANDLLGELLDLVVVEFQLP